MRLIDGPKAFEEAFEVSRETVERLELYARLLKQWQKAVNLVAPTTLDHIWHRHFADSAQLLRLAPPDARTWADLGSGAGFPGLVVAIMGAGPRRDCKITLVESDQRKAAFLREAARRTATPVHILSTRIESRETQQSVGCVDVLSARALAPLPRLLALAAPMFGSSTLGLFLKGQDIEGEISAARQAWDFDAELTPSLTAEGAFVARVRRIAAKSEGFRS